MKQLQISNQKMEELTVAIEDISKASNQIGGIIKTIEDIASQTNILALNAAVEAARASTADACFTAPLDKICASAAIFLDSEDTCSAVRLVTALIIVVILQMINLIFVRIRILSPVIAVRDQMGEIAEGNLSAEFRLQPDTSEIGMLVESIYTTKRELKNYIQDIRLLI